MSRTALMIMDYQAGILDRLPDPSALLDRASGAIDVVRSRGGDVGWVRVAFTDADFDALPAGSTMARLASRDRLHVDAPASQLVLSPAEGDIVVRKTRVGAFSTTDLADQLAARDVTRLVLAGISTSGVVLSTVREAMDRDYAIEVLADACADPDLEVHAFLTERIFPRHTTVRAVADL